MNGFARFYYRNIYGVIGTLLFHILLFLVLIYSNIGKKNEIKENELIIEFMEEPEPVKPEEPKPENNEAQPDNTAMNNGNVTNVASNRLAGSKSKADEALQGEIENARNLSKSVNSNLSRKTISIDEINMPVETTEGQEPDKIKNVVYSGESSVVYYLEKRYHVSLPIPVYLAQGGGKVIVDIVVNQQGKVISAKARKNPAIKDEMVFYYAEFAANNSVFNSDFNAPQPQKGTIHYSFSSQ